MFRYIRKFFRNFGHGDIETILAVFTAILGFWANFSDPIYDPMLRVFPLPITRFVLILLGVGLIIARTINGEGRLWTGFVRACFCVFLAVVFIIMAFGAGRIIPGSPAQIGYLMIAVILVMNGAKDALDWFEFQDECRKKRHATRNNTER